MNKKLGTRDEFSGVINNISGAHWYQQTSIRAVNQAIGRVIRHRWDFGTIILVDARYLIPENLNSISGWLRERISKYQDPSQFISDIGSFYQWNKLRDPKSG